MVTTSESAAAAMPDRATAAAFFVPAGERALIRLYREIRYRQIENVFGRFDVQRKDNERDGWFPVYSDDRSERAFEQMGLLSEVSGGVIVCAICGSEVGQPRLRDNSVTCKPCRHARISTLKRIAEDHFMPALIIAGLLAFICFLAYWTQIGGTW